jgi:hypothetical protein
VLFEGSIQIVSWGFHDDKWQLILPTERNLLMAKVAKKQVAGVICIPLVSLVVVSSKWKFPARTVSLVFKPNSSGQHKFPAATPSSHLRCCCDATLRCGKDNTPTRWVLAALININSNIISPVKGLQLKSYIHGSRPHWASERNWLRALILLPIVWIRAVTLFFKFERADELAFGSFTQEFFIFKAKNGSIQV